MKITLVLQNNKNYNDIYDNYPSDLLSTYIDVMEKQIVHLKCENKIFQDSLHELYKKIECGELDMNSLEFKQTKKELYSKLYENLLSIPRHEENFEEIYDWLNSYDSQENYLNDNEQIGDSLLDFDLNLDEDGNYISNPTVYYGKNPLDD